MDHVGQFETDCRVMSQISVGGADLCDNLPKPEALTAQTRNLNENLSASQTEEGGGHMLLHSTPLNNNGQDVEEQPGKEGYTGRGQDEDEEEDTDEGMKEEEEESEESSALIRCQSPDTPMTDSSYSETGSLLETPYPLSPGTSPETTSPVFPLASPGTLCPISPSDADTDSHISSPESIACITTITPGHKPVDSTALTLTSPPGPTRTTGTTDNTAGCSDVTTEHYTSSTEPMFNRDPTCTEGSVTSYSEPEASSTFKMSSTTGPPTLTTGPTTTGTESTSTTGPVTSNWELITSQPRSTSFSVPTPLKCLEELAHKGDDTHFPQHLHQLSCMKATLAEERNHSFEQFFKTCGFFCEIAETFVLHNDYQQALWCIQLERLYHQRVLDNLSALQEQWESKCRTSSILEYQHLDALKHICLTHSRPSTRDVVYASLDFVKPTFQDPLLMSAHEVDGGMEQIAEDPSCSQSSHPDIPSVILADRLKSPEILQKEKEEPDGELKRSDTSHGSQLTDKEHSSRERGEADQDVAHSITATGNGLHPSTAGAMDQSKPAEQQGGDSGPAQEKEAKKEDEERDVEEAVDALEMKDEGNEEEEVKQEKSAFCQKALPVETVVSGAKVEVQQLHQEILAEETQNSAKTFLHQEPLLPQEAHVKLQEQGEEEEEEEEEEEDEEYEIEQADIIREAASLDNMAKRITVEEMSPASGLVSILKRRSVRVDNMSVSVPSDKPIAKRRVRFKVPDDGYEQDVGGGDSCLLLILLCLVTVVISVGGTALYCALGDVQSSVCQDFSRNADFYFGQIQRGITQIQHWFSPGS